MKNILSEGKYDYTHLTLELRKIINSCLDEGYKLIKISELINKDPRTISKEIKRNRTLIDYSKKRQFLNKDISFMEPCKTILKYPFVCNSCKKKRNCFLDHFIYDFNDAQIKYEKLLTSSREGIDLTKDELKNIDELIKDGVKNGKSIYSICETNKNKITKTPNTIYTYVHKGIISTTPLDLRRSAKMKPRIKSGKYAKTRDDKDVYINRTIDYYFVFLANNPTCMQVEIDTVEGSENSSKYLLTIHFVETHFMLIYLINSQTSLEVKRVLDDIEFKIGLDNFKRIFKVILADRGKEFMDPVSFETSIDGVTKRTNVFYCDAMNPNQKPHIEKNHVLIRYVIPKGSFMNNYTDNNILLLTSHINSYIRRDLGGKCPYDMFVLFYGEDILDRLYIDKVEPNDVNLTPSLFVK